MKTLNDIAIPEENKNITTNKIKIDITDLRSDSSQSILRYQLLQSHLSSNLEKSKETPKLTFDGHSYLANNSLLGSGEYRYKKHRGLEKTELPSHFNSCTEIVPNTDRVASSRLNQRHKKTIQNTFSHKEESCNDFVYSYLKCDICSCCLEVDDLAIYNRCANCLTSYHFSCYRDFGDKGGDMCRKCQNDKYFKYPCIICGRFYGSMVKCDNNYVHIFCMLAFKAIFYKKADSLYQWGLDYYKINKVSHSCAICKRSNNYTVKCSVCELTFHPYCGLLSNFDFYTIELKNTPSNIFHRIDIKFTCENHQHFKPVKNIRRVITDKKEQEYSPRLIRSKKTKNIRPQKQKHHPESSTITTISHIRKKTKINKIRLRSSEKEINLHSLNYKALKKLMSGKLENQVIKFKTDWTWDITDQYFINNSQELAGCLSSNINFQESNGSILGQSLININYFNKEFSKLKENNFTAIIKNQKRSEYLAIFNAEKLYNSKTNSKILNEKEKEEDTKKFAFINKRARSGKDLQINKRFKNSQETTDCDTNEKKLLPNPDLSLDLNGHTSENNNNPVSSSETKGVNQRFLKRMRLLGYKKLKKSERNYLKIEENSFSNIQKYMNGLNLNIFQLEDIDRDIFINNDMLNSIFPKNCKTIASIRHSILNSKTSDNPVSQDKQTLMRMFRSVNKFTFIRTRIIKGCGDKSIADIIKTRNNRTLEADIEQLSEKDKSDMRTFSLKVVGDFPDCCVCMQTDLDDLTPTVYCDNCSVPIHQECYGLKEIPVGDFYCDACKYNISIKEKLEHSNVRINLFPNETCVLCLQTHGAMKNIDKNGVYWAHIFCVILSEMLHFEEYETMETILGFEGIKENNHKCLVCNNYNGEIIACSLCSETSDMPCSYFHALCAYLHGYQIRIEEKQAKSADVYFVYRKLFPVINCEAHETIQRNREHQKYFRQAIYHRDIPIHSKKERSKAKNQAKEANN